MENQVEMIEIWATTDGKDAEAVQFNTGKNIKRVAIIVNGYPIKLEKDFIMERKFINKEQADLLV